MNTNPTQSNRRPGMKKESQKSCSMTRCRVRVCVYTQSMTSQPITRTARQTKTLVTVITARDLNVDDCGGTLKWYSICEEHGTAIAHPTKALANFFAPVPCEWCAECAETHQGGN